MLKIRFANGDPAAPLRKAAHEVLDSISGAEVADALLVISELVQNVSQHTRSDGVLSIDVVDRDVLIQVADSDPAPPEPQTPDADRAGGRGLLLVAAVTTGWGVRPTTQGKIVWARLPLAVRPGWLDPLPAP